jgi:hypothetical protein
VPAILLFSIRFGKKAFRALHGKSQMVKKLPNVSRMVGDVELLLDNTGNHRGVPGPRKKAVSHRTTEIHEIVVNLKSRRSHHWFGHRC